MIIQRRIYEEISCGSCGASRGGIYFRGLHGSSFGGKQSAGGNEMRVQVSEMRRGMRVQRNGYEERHLQMSLRRRD